MSFPWYGIEAYLPTDRVSASIFRDVISLAQECGFVLAPVENQPGAMRPEEIVEQNEELLSAFLADPEANRAFREDLHERVQNWVQDDPTFRATLPDRLGRHDRRITSEEDFVGLSFSCPPVGGGMMLPGRKTGPFEMSFDWEPWTAERHLPKNLFGIDLFAYGEPFLPAWEHPGAPDVSWENVRFLWRVARRMFESFDAYIVRMGVEGPFVEFWADLRAGKVPNVFGAEDCAALILQGSIVPREALADVEACVLEVSKGVALVAPGILDEPEERATTSD